MKPFIQPADQTLGNAKGVFQLICYGDYLCPTSREVHFAVSQLLAAFEGKIHYAFRPFPQWQHQPLALLVARAVEAAGRQGHYWPMHYALFRHPGRHDLDGLYDLAHAVGLHPERFHADLHDPALTHLLLTQGEEARRLGVRTAPALFLNGARQANTAPWCLQEQMERWLTASSVGRLLGTVDRLRGTVHWGHRTGL
ncbi:MAG: thioredoxin domain-containing protein [Cytophagales bacterium]|nr:thioredoxin domain-containing protein [Cytophagales bacterium]